jgi:hypothetical protein
MTRQALLTLNSSGFIQTFLNNNEHVDETISGVTRRKPSGWIPPTAYSYTRTEYDRCVGVCDCQVVPGNRSIYTGVVGSNNGRFNALNHYNGAISIASARGLSSSEGVSNRSLQAARINLKGTKVNLGVAFGERKQTARQLGDAAFSIAKSFQALRRGNVRRAMDELGISSRKHEPRGSNVTNKWLGLQYGWKPLLSDVYGACDALARRNADDWSVIAKGKARAKNYYKYAVSPVFNGANGSASNGFDACTVTAEVTTGALTRIDAIPANTALQSFTSLGLTNPLLIAWELVPFSFVVDWALPIGSWLDSLDATLGFANAWTCTSVLTKSNWTDVGVSKTQTSGTYAGKSWIRNSYRGTQRDVQLVRTVSYGVPVPRFPRIKDPRSLGHMANGLALLSQVFGR